MSRSSSMNGAEFVESFYAVAKIGAVNVPLNWRLVPDELEFIVADAGATVLVYGAEFAVAADELRFAGDATAIEHWIQASGDTADGAVDYDDWLGAESDAEPALAGSDDDLVFIMYTSGTTGPPKGVMHTHETVMWAIQTINTTDGLPGRRPVPQLVADVPRRSADTEFVCGVPGR